MYIVPIAWLYVALMMALAEATSTTGSLLGAAITFILYGLLPIGLVMYVMGTPARRRAIKAREQADTHAGAQPPGRNLSIAGEIRPEGWAPTGSRVVPDVTESGVAPDADCQAPTDPITTVRKEA